jgi:hypothetical protein
MIAKGAVLVKALSRQPYGHKRAKHERAKHDRAQYGRAPPHECAQHEARTSDGSSHPPTLIYSDPVVFDESSLRLLFYLLF